MEKEVKLFDKRFVYFMWDDELKGKKVFVADNINSLIERIEKGTSIYKVYWSRDTAMPFESNDFVRYRFAYYDPNYEAKWAYYKEGKKVQFKNCFGNWNDRDTPEWYDNYEYRVKPESLGYARVETKGSDCDKQEGYTLAVSKCHWEDYIDYALPKENILDKPECPCEEGIDSKACAGCPQDEARKQTFRPFKAFKDCDELVDFWSKNYQTGFRPAYTKPLIWVRLKCDGRERLIVAFGTDFVEIGNKEKAVPLQKLFDDYEFLNGSPCGKEC